MAVPLAIMQCASQTLHTNVPSCITPHEFAIDVALSYSIYAKDRFHHNSTQTARALSTLSTFAATAAYASDAFTLPLAPIVPWLHYEYATQKARLAPVKPFFVAALWTMATYYQPFLIRHDVGALFDPIPPVMLFFLFSSISHTADIPDIDADLQDGVRTPAAILGEDNAKALTIGLLAASVYAHSSIAQFDVFDVLYDLASLLSITSRIRSPLFGVAVSCVFVVNLYPHYDPEMWVRFVSSLLSASEPVHKAALQALPATVEWTREWPEPFRRAALNAVLDAMPLGDWMGGQLLDLYAKLARATYLSP